MLKLTMVPYLVPLSAVAFAKQIDRMQFVTYLPLSYNDGGQVPAAEMQAIIAELFQRFGGATVSGPVQGHWMDTTTGQAFSDESLRVEIATQRERLAEVQSLILEIGK